MMIDAHTLDNKNRPGLIGAWPRIWYPFKMMYRPFRVIRIKKIVKKIWMKRLMVTGFSP